MKLLLVAPRYYPHIGGVECVVRSVAERLAKKGHDVTVLAGEQSVEKSYEEVINGVSVVRWPTWSLGGAYHFPKRWWVLEEWVKKEVSNVDVVHVHSAHSVFSVETGLIIKKLKPGIRLIFTLHYHGGGHSLLRNLLWLVWKSRVTKLIESSDIIHAVSKAEGSRILKHYPHASGKVMVIPNGVEEDVLRYWWIGENSSYMIYAGRIERYKNLDKAIEIAKQLGLKLLVIGDGSYKKRFEIKARRTYPDGVIIENFLPRNRYLELLSGARYAIAPSRREAFSIFIAEALAIGVPAIVSKEIAVNLDDGGGRMFEGELAIVEKARIDTWGKILKEYIKEIYGFRGEL